MTQRTPDDLKHELQALDQAHAQNEAARDSFVALAHTALFAASVSFVGSAVPLAKAVWWQSLIAGWALDVIGLLSLTISFASARKAIDARRAALYVETPPIAAWSERLNGIALWSFPAALLCLFSFVVANVVHINEQSVQPSATSVSIRRIERNNPAATCTVATRGSIAATDRRDTGAQGARRPASPAAAASSDKEISRKP